MPGKNFTERSVAEIAEWSVGEILNYGFSYPKSTGWANKAFDKLEALKALDPKKYEAVLDLVEQLLVNFINKSAAGRKEWLQSESALAINVKSGLEELRFTQGLSRSFIRVAKIKGADANPLITAIAQEVSRKKIKTTFSLVSAIAKGTEAAAAAKVAPSKPAAGPQA